VLQLSAAFVDNESRVYALESGADAYLTQPVEPNVLIATVKSLVKLHEAESLAKLAAKQWQSTFDALGEGVAIIDPAENIQRCNRAMTQLLHKSYTEIEGQPLKQVIKDTMAFDLPHDAERRPIEISVGTRSFRLSLEPILLDEVHTGSIFVVADTTQQKQAELAALLNERLAATGRMAHTIAHEINNPLAGITNLLYLLRHSVAGSPEGKEHLRAAEEEVARVSRIARQILSFNRESAKPTEVDLPTLLDDVLALNNRELVDRSVQVIRKWNGPVRVLAFPAQLRQVFSNLLRNAIEASPKGSQIYIKISSYTLSGGNSRRAARVTVCDQGVGIPKQNLGKIFEAFFTTKELKGSGVGLWLSSNIVQQHRGRIVVKSRTTGRSGTCVSVLLPEQPSDMSDN
jgi:signal transduction histidine kinase